jgi:hypothetical protein
MKTGEEMADLIKRVYATPEPVRQRLVEIYQVGLGEEKK